MRAFLIKTYSCPACGYRQDYAPTLENHAVHFPRLTLSANDCPACVLAHNVPSKLSKETDPQKKMRLVVADEAEVLIDCEQHSDAAVVEDFRSKAMAEIREAEALSSFRYSDAEKERMANAKLNAAQAQIQASQATRKSQLGPQKVALLAQQRRDLALALDLQDPI